MQQGATVQCCISRILKQSIYLQAVLPLGLNEKFLVMAYDINGNIEA